MHSSRMHTTCLLTVSQHAFLGGSVPTQGVYLPGGVPALGGCTCLGGICLGGVPARGYLPEGGVPAHWGVPAWGGCTCPGERGVPAQGVHLSGGGYLPRYSPMNRIAGAKILPCPKLHLRAVTTPLFSLRTVSLASLQSCCSVDADTFCKRALNVYTVSRFPPPPLLEQVCR